MLRAVVALTVANAAGVLIAVAPVLSSSAKPYPSQHSFNMMPLNSFGKCLDVAGASTDDGARVIQYTCNRGRNQAFVSDNRTTDGLIRIVHSNKCLDIDEGSKANGAALIQYQCHGGDNQRFRMRNGSLQAVASGKCLDVEAENRENGARLIQYQCSTTSLDNPGRANQRFSIYPTDETGAPPALHYLLSCRDREWMSSAGGNHRTGKNFVVSFIPTAQARRVSRTSAFATTTAVLESRTDEVLRDLKRCAAFPMAPELTQPQQSTLRSQLFCHLKTGISREGGVTWDLEATPKSHGSCAR